MQATVRTSFVVFAREGLRENMVAAIAKIARYFTMAAYGLMCFWFVFGVGQVSAAGGFFAAVVAVVMLLRVMDGWNNVVAAAEYEYIIGGGLARVLAIVVGVLVEGAIAYGFYYLSQWVGDASRGGTSPGSSW